MTTTPHGQVPEALIDLIDAYAETRHRCGGIYNAKTEAARNAVIEALSGVQALSAAPAGFVPVAAFDRLHAHAESLAARLLAAEQAAPKAAQAEVLGWIYEDELPESYPYSAMFLHSKVDTVRMFPVFGPTAAPGDVLDEALRERDDAEDFIDALLDEVLGHERPEWSSSYGRADALNDVQERMTALHKPAVDKAWGQFQSAMAAPQQEAQEPVAWQSRTRPTWEGNTSPWSPWKPCTKEQAEDYWKTPLLNDWAHEARALYTAPHEQVPDSIRVPLDSLHADAEYLIGRLLAGTLTREQVVGVIRDRIDAARAVLAKFGAPQPSPAARGDALDAARYRWLRASTNYVTSNGERIDVRNMPEKWDSAIDAARKQGASHE